MSTWSSKLLALFGCVARGFVVVLFFSLDSVGQYQLVLDCTMSELPASLRVRVFRCIWSRLLLFRRLLRLAR